MKQHEPTLDYPRRSLAYTKKYANKIQNRLHALPWKLFFIDTQKGFYLLKALGNFAFREDARNAQYYREGMTTVLRCRLQEASTASLLGWVNWD